LSEQIGSFNTQLQELSDKYKAEQTKAEAEAKKTGFDFKPKTDQMLAEEQTQRDELADTLIKLVGETEGRRYEGIDIAGGLPTAIDESIKTVPLLGEQVAGETEDTDSIRRTIEGTDTSGNPYQYTIVIDKETGDVGYEVFTGNISGDPTSQVGGTTTFYKDRPIFNERGEAQQIGGVEELLGQRLPKEIAGELLVELANCFHYLAMQALHQCKCKNVYFYYKNLVDVCNRLIDERNLT
jgi:hypothetical protein